MRHAKVATFIIASMLLTAGFGTGGCTAGDADATGTPDTGSFVECMRAHGLQDFPDVTVSSEGLVNFEIDGERVDVRSETYGAAIQQCQGLLPARAWLPGAPEAPRGPAAP
jgi:hypothetical protein